MLPVTHQEQPFGNRLDDLRIALQQARESTADSRRYNRERLAKKANVSDIEVGDFCVLKAEERLTLTSKWDPNWQVTRVRGTTLWLRQQQTGRTKVVHREKVMPVDSEINWDEINPRPVRNSRKSTVPVRRESDRRPPPIEKAEEPARATPKRRRRMNRPADKTIAVEPRAESDMETIPTEPVATIPAPNPDVPRSRRPTPEPMDIGPPAARTRARTARHEMMELDLTSMHGTKRANTTGLEERQQKRARCEAIELVRAFCA